MQNTAVYVEHFSNSHAPESKSQPRTFLEISSLCVEPCREERHHGAVVMGHYLQACQERETTCTESPDETTN